MNDPSLAQYLAVTGTLPKLDQLAAQTVKIGFLAPLSGPVESWGLPGLQGATLWAERLNAEGGLLVGKQRHPVEIISYDTLDDPERTARGAQMLVDQERVCLIMTLGGTSLRAVQPFLNARKVLTSTLLPSDLSPDTPYLIAPSETHPVYVVTGVQYLCKTQRPKSVALCAQRDAMGMPSLATYRAAFKAEDVTLAAEVIYDPNGSEAEAERIVGEMMAADPDVLCWCTSYPSMVHALTEAAFKAGFTGAILSCTADGYQQLVDKTSRDFMEGFTFQFPDFDDPALADRAFFQQPRNFYNDYIQRFPDSWSAVSWEYAAILDLWRAAVQRASTVSPMSVLAAMKMGGQATHAFGTAQWWGREVFGIDNALVGDWPVVQIRKGKAQIMRFASVIAWLEEHEALLKAEMRELGQLWQQRTADPGPVMSRRVTGGL